MERIALIFDSIFVYWSDILLVLAVVTAVCMYLSLIISEERPAAVFLSVPLSLIGSLLLARLVHWYCRENQYDSLTVAMTNFRFGGFALVGVFAGCVLAAALLRIVRLSKNLPQMLDCMAIAGSLGIAVGRLACFFNTENRGMIVTTLTGLPWAWTVTNQVSGTQEVRLATFFLQALVAAVLFCVLLVSWHMERKRENIHHGDICVIFLLCYGASQVLLDSTRYDSLYFRSNGFVSIVQVLGACGIGLAAILFSVRLVRCRGWKRWYAALWTVLAVLIGLAGYMEYFVQRYGNKIVLGYSVMAAALLGIVVMVLVIRALAVSARQKQALMMQWTR